MRLPRRLSIAGLMAIVLVCSLGLVALRSQSGAWAGGAYLVTYAVLLLAIVGAFCRRESERAWWIGFALFGIAYFRTFGTLGFGRLKLPTTEFLDLIRPAGVAPFGDFAPDSLGYYWLVGHCLWTLLAATCGGGLAVVLFAVPHATPPQPEAVPVPAVQPARVPWRLIVAFGLAGLVPGSALVLVSPLAHPAFWASALYLATWVVLGITVLGFACRRGKRRMVWFGAALFGLGYMVLNRAGDRFEEYSYVHLVADEFLEAVRPMLPGVVGGFPAPTAELARENARIRQSLDRQVPMRFRAGTTLGDLLDYLRATTKAADGREVPIYVDPQGLQDADKTLESTVQIDLERCSLATALRLALPQLNLFFDLTNGMVYITSHSADYPFNKKVDYYLLAGHCMLALLAAGLGALLVPLVSHREA